MGRPQPEPAGPTVAPSGAVGVTSLKLRLQMNMLKIPKMMLGLKFQKFIGTLQAKM